MDANRTDPSFEMLTGTQSEPIPYRRAKLPRFLTLLWAGFALLLFLCMGGGRGFLPSNMEGARHIARKSKAAFSLNSLAIALEKYAADHGAYPPGRPLRDSVRDPKLMIAAGGEDLETVEPGRGASLHGLTTPVPYLESSLLVDPFTGLPPRRRWYSRGPDVQPPIVGAWPFAYHASADGKGWILWSPGPDEVYDIRDPATLYLPGVGHNPALIELTYDPTNGERSRGDVFRVKE